MSRNTKRSVHRDPLQDSSSSEDEEAAGLGQPPTGVGSVDQAHAAESNDTASENDDAKTSTSEEEEGSENDDAPMDAPPTTHDATMVQTPPPTPRAATPSATPTSGTPQHPVAAQVAGSLDPRSPVGGLQVVSTRDEANALVKHLKRLEQENNQFSLSLTNICNENARLTDRLAEVQEQLGSLSIQPLQGTSVLQALFDKDQHAGWLSGGKSATKEKLQHTLDDLQNEFIAYRQTHMTTNDEVHALVQELQSAHTHSAKLAGMVREMQKQQAKGAATIRVVVEDTPKPSALPDEFVPMRTVLDERHASAMKLASFENELRKAHSDFAALLREQQLTNKIVEREQQEAARDKAELVAETAKRTALDKLLAESKKKLSQLQQEHDELVSTNARLEEELTTISNRMAVKEEMQRQVLLETTQQRDSETNNLTLRVMALEAELVDARALYEQERGKRQTDKTSFERQLEAMRDQLKDQVQERAATESANQAAETTVATLTAHNEALERQLSAKTAECNDATARMADAQAQHAQSDRAWDERLSTSEATMSALRQEMDALRHGHEVTLQQHEKDLLELQQRLVKAQESIADYESELGKTVSLQNFLMMETKCQRLEDEVALLQEQKTSVEAAVATLRASNGALEAKLAESAAAVKSKNEEIATLNAKAASLGTKVLTLDASRSDDVTALKTAHERELTDVRAQHEKELSQLQTRLVEAQEAIANYESELGKTVSLQNFLMMETKCQRLEDEVALLQEQKASVESLLTTKLTTLEAANNEERSVAKQRNELLLKRCAGLTQEKNVLEQRLVESGSATKELQPQLETLSGAHHELQSKYDALREAHTQLETKWNDLSDAFNATERRSAQTISQVESDKASLDAEKMQLMAAVSSLEADCTHHAQAAKRLEAEVEHLTKDKGALMQDLVRAREAMSQMDLINTKSQLTLEQMGAVEAEKERMHDELERLQSTTANDQQTIQTLKEQLQSAHRTNDALQLEVCDLQTAVKTVVGEMESARTAHAEALTALDKQHRVDIEKVTMAANRPTPPDPTVPSSRGETLEGELRIHKQMIADLEAQMDVLTTELDAVRRASSEQERQFAQEMTTMMEAVVEERNELERKHNEELSSAIAAAATSAAGSRRSQSRDPTPSGASSSDAAAAYDELHQKYQDVLQNKVKNEAALNKRITTLEAQLATTVREFEERTKERTKSYEAELEQCRKHIASLAALSPKEAASTQQQTRRVETVTGVKQGGPADDSVSAAAYYAIKCDNDRLHDEIKRQSSKFKEKEAEYQVLLQRGGAGGKGATAATRSPTSRSPTNPLPAGMLDDANTAGMVVALRTANATLLAEKEALLQQLGEAQKANMQKQPRGATDPLSTTSLFSADEAKRAMDTLEAKHETTVMQLTDLKRQLEERKALNTTAAASFHAALDASEKEIAALKDELASLKRQQASTTAAGTLDTPDADTSVAGRKTKLKSKTTTGHGGRKKSLLGTAPAVDDILLSAQPSAGGTGPSTEDISRLEKLVDERSKELDRRTAEVTTLKAKVQELMTELRAAQKDVEDLHAQHEDELHGLREELRNVKEARLEETASVVVVPPVIETRRDVQAVPTRTPPTNATAAAARDDDVERMGKTIADGNRKIVELQDVIANQRKRIELLEMHLSTAEAKATAAEESCKTLLATTVALQKQPQVEEVARPRSAHSSRSPTPLQVDSVLPDGAEELKARIRLLEEQNRKRDAADAELMRETQTSMMEMDKRMRIKNKEVDETKRVIVRLTGELLPLKEKLAEYSAFVDRAGVAYPFPETLEGTQLIRLQSLSRTGGGSAVAASGSRPAAMGGPPSGGTNAAPTILEETPARRAPTTLATDPSPVAPPRARDRATRTRTLPRV